MFTLDFNNFLIGALWLQSVEIMILTLYFKFVSLCTYCLPCPDLSALQAVFLNPYNHLPGRYFAEKKTKA